MKKLLTICLVMATIFVVKAQAHISTGAYACSLVPKSLGAEKYRCPACERIDENRRLAKIAEDKRRSDAVLAKSKADEAAAQAAFKKQKEERAAKNKVTEVFVTMPKSNNSGEKKTNSDTEKEENIHSDSSSSKVESLADNSASSSKSASESFSTSNSGSSTPEATIHNNVFMAEAAKKYQEEKAVNDLLNGIFGIKTPEERAVAYQQDQDAYAKKVKMDNDFREARFKKFLPLMANAEKGDERLRMILYFADVGLFLDRSRNNLPDRQKWLEQAVANGNESAILEKAFILAAKVEPGYIGHKYYFSSDFQFEKALPYLEKLAVNKNLDAMMLMAHWYDKASYSDELGIIRGGSNAQLAMEWFQKAAHAGSPNAMYYLGMIYKYGKTHIYNKLYDNKNYYSQKDYDEKFIIYNAQKDESIAFDWFLRAAIEVDYKPSLFHLGRWETDTYNPYHYSSYFEKKTFLELAEMYKKGKVVTKDKDKAAESTKQYYEYKLPSFFDNLSF